MLFRNLLRFLACRKKLFSYQMMVINTWETTLYMDLSRLLNIAFENIDFFEKIYKYKDRDRDFLIKQLGAIKNSRHWLFKSFDNIYFIDVLDSKRIIINVNKPLLIKV